MNNRPPPPLSFSAVLPPLLTVARFAVCVSYARYSRKINKQQWAALAESSNLATQAITNIRTVRAFGTEAYEDEQYREATAEALDKSILDAKASSLSYTLTSYLDLGTTVLLLWYGGLVVMNKEDNTDDPLTVGKLITFQLYWNMMNSAYSTNSSTQHTTAPLVHTTHAHFTPIKNGLFNGAPPACPPAPRLVGVELHPGPAQHFAVPSSG